MYPSQTKPSEFGNINRHRPLPKAMSTGYVLLDVEPGTEYSVFEKASSLPFVSDAQVLFGDHDMILKIEAESMGEIAKLVVDSVRSIPGVTNTKTLACAELQNSEVDIFR